MNLDLRRRASDSGFTLIEAVICIALMGILSTVIAAAIVVTIKTSPAVADRADTAVNVQGLVTWLPQDVDSAAPGSFDTAAGATSGCPGIDPGVNILKVTWSEQITSTTNFAASYRFVPATAPAVGGIVYRVYCALGTAPSVLKVTGLLPQRVSADDPIKVILSDSAPKDLLNDSAKIIVRPLTGNMIVIDAASKNPAEVLSAPTTTSPAPTTTSPPPANTAPTATSSTAAAIVGTPVSINASAFDADGNDPLTLQILSVTPGWTANPTSGLAMNVLAPAAGVGSISFQVTDSLGAVSSPATITITATAPAAANQPPSASPSSGSTTAGAPVTVKVVASDPENAALTASVTSVPPVGWNVTVSGTNVTVTPPNTAPVGTTVMNYKVTDPLGAAASSTLSITVTGPPPCVITGPTLSDANAPLKNKNSNPDALDKEVTVTIDIVSGYCVGLSLRYVTGAPNAQYVRTFSDSGTTRSVVLPKHPSPELWAVGPRVLDVRDSSSKILGSTTLTVTQ